MKSWLLLWDLRTYTCIYWIFSLTWYKYYYYWCHMYMLEAQGFWDLCIFIKQTGHALLNIFFESEIFFEHCYEPNFLFFLCLYCSLKIGFRQKRQRKNYRPLLYSLAMSWIKKIGKIVQNDFHILPNEFFHLSFLK